MISAEWITRMCAIEMYIVISPVNVMRQRGPAVLLNRTNINFIS